MRKVSDATVLTVAVAPPFAPNALASASIAFFASGEDRFDWTVTAPAACLTGPVFAEVAQAARKLPEPTAPRPARLALRRKRRRDRPALVMS